MRLEMGGWMWTDGEPVTGECKRRGALAGNDRREGERGGGGEGDAGQQPWSLCGAVTVLYDISHQTYTHADCDSASENSSDKLKKQQRSCS